MKKKKNKKYENAKNKQKQVSQTTLTSQSPTGSGVKLLQLFCEAAQPSNEERNRMPTYAIQWAAIQWAKSQGCTQYDLWGLPDEDAETMEAEFKNRSDGLWGVYRFKRGFGFAHHAVHTGQHDIATWHFRVHLNDVRGSLQCRRRPLISKP